MPLDEPNVACRALRPVSRKARFVLGLKCKDKHRRNHRWQRRSPRAQDYSQWYIDIVLNAKLADYSPVKGCM